MRKKYVPKKKYTPKPKKSSMTNKQRLYKMIKENKRITQKELKNNFTNKKELFTDLQKMIDARIVGMVDSVDVGQTYYVKKNLY